MLLKSPQVIFNGCMINVMWMFCYLFKRFPVSGSLTNGYLPFTVIKKFD